MQGVTSTISAVVDGTSSVWKDVRVGKARFTHLNLDGLLQKVDAGAYTERQRWVMELLGSLKVQMTTGLLICLNMVLVILETDKLSADDIIPTWLIVANRLLIVVYSIEIVARLYAFKVMFFRSPFNMVDFLVVGCDLVLETYTVVSGNVVPNLAWLRALRLARLTRAYRMMTMVPMLSGMVRDLLGALQAVLWGCLLLAVFITLWSILGVQLIHPIVEELARDTDVFYGCDRCPRAFATVWQANLTLFQAIVAGDSWGTMALPIIEHAWWTSIFFIGTVFTLNLMLMNVILAVVVEKADETRQNDLHEKMRYKVQQFAEKSKKMLRACKALDEDGSGDLTLNELLQGFHSTPDLQATFHDMGIEEDDMKTVFAIMDSDRSGRVDYNEFVQHIHKMKTSDETTLLNFLKHYVLEILKKVGDLEEDLGIPRAKSRLSTTTKQTTEAFENAPKLFEENHRLNAMDNGVVVKDISFQSREVCTPAQDVINLQRDCTALMERVSHDLVQAVNVMGSVSDEHLKLLRSMERSMVSLASRDDVTNSSRAQLDQPKRLSKNGGREQPSSTSEPESTRHSTGSCCSAERGSRNRLLISSG